MHIRVWCLSVLAAFFYAGYSTAQVSGLPVGDGAEALESGRIRVSVGGLGGFALNAAEKFDGSDRAVYSYGGRVEYGFRNGWKAFADAGLLDPEEADHGAGIQAGAQYTLDRPWMPYTLAIRGTAGWAAFSDPIGVDFSWLTFSLGALASTSRDAWTPYGFLGFRLLREEESFFGFTNDRWLASPLVGAGVTYALPRDFSLYSEISYVGGVWVAGGLRWTFF